MVILITGGSSGLGEAITRRLSADGGNKVYFTYNSSKTNADQIMADCANAVAIKCDFKIETEVNALKDQVTAIGPDILINNAYHGAFIKSYFHKTAPDDFLTGFMENIVPVIAITQAAINVFRKKKSGKIITISTSALLNVPPTGASVYAANKAYIAKMTKVWASENAKYNITSNTVSPAFMLTGFTGDMDERIVDQMIRNHPLKRLLTTQEVADSVHYLAHSSAQVNGIDIVINSAANIN